MLGKLANVTQRNDIDAPVLEIRFLTSTTLFFIKKEVKGLNSPVGDNVSDVAVLAHGCCMDGVQAELDK